MTYVALYVVTLVLFLVVDALWIKFVTLKLFQAHIGHMLVKKVRLGVAAGFYAFFVVGVVYFAQVPALHGGGWTTALLNGTLLGLLAYGTYEATNMATLEGWSWSMVGADVAWGGLLTGISATAGFWIVTALGWTGG